MTWSPVSPGEPRGKGGKQGGQGSPGRRAIPPGVETAVQAEALAFTGRIGEQAALARKYGVSRDYVKRLAEHVRGTDPDEIMLLKQRLPSRLTILAAGTTEKALEAVERDDAGAATKWTFASKLAVEANRWAQPAADNPGATLLSFIEALGKAGGGSLTVTPDPRPIEITAEIIQEPVEAETLMPE